MLGDIDNKMYTVTAMLLHRYVLFGLSDKRQIDMHALQAILFLRSISAVTFHFESFSLNPEAYIQLIVYIIPRARLMLDILKFQTDYLTVISQNHWHSGKEVILRQVNCI